MSPRMTLLEYRPISNAGALVGRARVLLPMGLKSPTSLFRERRPALGSAAVATYA